MVSGDSGTAPWFEVEEVEESGIDDPLLQEWLNRPVLPGTVVMRPGECNEKTEEAGVRIKSDEEEEEEEEEIERGSEGL